MAGELGHLIIDDGKYFEELAAGKRLKQLTRKHFKKELVITDLLKMKNEKAKKILDELSMYLGQGIASLINSFDPEVVILNGGVKESGSAYLKLIKKQTKKYMIIPRKPNIQWSKLKHPGVLGASLI